MLIFLFLTFVSLGNLGLCTNDPSCSKISDSIDDPSFQTLDLLGSGGYAFVLKVRLRSTNKIYAMKVPRDFGTGNIAANDLFQELKILQCLHERLREPVPRHSIALLSPEIQHPISFDFKASLLPDRPMQHSFKHFLLRCIRPEASDEDEDSLEILVDLIPRGYIPAMVFPLYEGGDLETLLDQVKNGEKRLRDFVLIELAIGIVRALQVLHSTGYVHQDLKPANILLDSSQPIPGSDIGQPVLADLGLAMQSGEVLKGPTGTLGYIAPEKLRKGHVVDFVQDVFSLGSVFMEVFSRCNLGTNSLSSLKKKMFQDYRTAFIGRCLSKNAALRPSLDEIIGNLEELREQGLSGTPFV